jgi:hypothetical protein
MSIKTKKFGDPRKRSVNHSKTETQYFGVWEYRENENTGYKIIMSILKNQNRMFDFPLINQFGYIDIKTNLFIPKNDSIKTDMFGIITLDRIEYNIDYTGFSFLFGGYLTDTVSDNWIGDTNIKLWNGGKLILNRHFGRGNLRDDLEKFCCIRES